MSRSTRGKWRRALLGLESSTRLNLSICGRRTSRFLKPLRLATPSMCSFCVLEFDRALMRELGYFFESSKSDMRFWREYCSIREEKAPYLGEEQAQTAPPTSKVEHVQSVA